uniref:Ammonium transporter n=1 Tax=Nostoc sp. 'Peltula cylindrica cyanobiont' TaxID=1307841 RepID=R4TPR9_9NOSO|nr:ammonium transporter [Nostoc sp. 'Peltula cylindrica cyanobiont']
MLEETKQVLKKILITSAIALGLLIPLMGQAIAAPADANAAITNAQTSADTAFMLMAAALVLLMTPGLAFFYGGFVRSRNILNTLMMSFVLMAIVGVTWILWGYSLAFAPGLPFIGGLQWFGLNGVSPADTANYLPRLAYETGLANDKVLTSYAPTIPHQAFMIYQAMFAIITPALISGAIVERISFTAYSLFVLLWSTLIYSPLAHMVWAKGGFLGLAGGLGALDFAGGTVVHISSGVSALVAAYILGPRKTYPDRLAPPHNVPFILLGAGLLWFGWFGFNAGSALASGSLATVAFVATNTGAAAAALTWLILEKVLRGKPTAVGAATGAVAGLVGITPAAGFVTPLAAILIGSITAFACFYAVTLKAKLQFDDSLDTFPVHGVGGTVGAILTGVFATTEVNAAGKDGLLRGNPSQVVTQIIAVIVAYIVAAVGTFILMKILEATVGLRLKPDAEIQGMDINEHGEEGYNEEFGGERLTVPGE